MKKQFLTYLLLFFSLTSWTQNHYDLCDKHEPIEKNWGLVKNEFIPKDLHSYVLLFEYLDKDENNKREKTAAEYYNVNSDNGHTKKWNTTLGFFGISQTKSIKRFKKNYSKEYFVVRFDSIVEYPIKKHRYILRCYSEPIKLWGNGKWEWRTGYIIYDRLDDKVFPMIVIGSNSKRDKWFFKNL